MKEQVETLIYVLHIILEIDDVEAPVNISTLRGWRIIHFVSMLEIVIESLNNANGIIPP